MLSLVVRRNAFMSDNMLRVPSILCKMVETLLVKNDILYLFIFFSFVVLSYFF